MTLPLVMIPAFGCDEGLYAPVVSKLGGAADIRVIAGTADRFSKMIPALLAEVPPRFVALGTSMGGRLALETTLAAPERVAGLVVIGAGAGGVADPTAGHRRTIRLTSGEMEGVLADMGAIIAHLPGPRGPQTRDAFMAMGRKTGAAIMARQSDALAHREDLWGRLAEIACPVLCLWGDNDQFSPAADGRRLASAVKNGRYVELPDCGHFPTLEYPNESAAAIAGWLAECSLV